MNANTVVCPRCYGMGNEQRTPLPIGLPIAEARKRYAPCAGCGGLGYITISYYRALQRAQRLVRKVYAR